MLKATPVITWATPADIVYGTALSATQLNATTTVPGTFVYTPPATTVLSAGAAQTLSMTFTPTDAANYNTANKSVAITVLKATPVITWATPAGIVYGTALERDAAERDDDGARHVRLHAAGGHGAVGRRGADAVDDVHADRHGELQHREQVGDDQRRSRRRRSSPGRTRPTSSTAPRSSATQLNATTTVPGTFVYTPPASTVLSAGAAQTLSTTFTPTDAANYTTATKAVDDQRRQGDAGHHLGEPGRHRLRHRAERDPAERDDDGARHVRLHAGAARCCRPARRRRCR